MCQLSTHVSTISGLLCQLPNQPLNQREHGPPAISVPLSQQCIFAVVVLEELCDGLKLVDGRVSIVVAFVPRADKSCVKRISGSSLHENVKVL